MQETTRLRPWKDTILVLRPWLGYVSQSTPVKGTAYVDSRQVLEVCYKCGVKAVTVYAFSLENFNRPKGEVDGLMLLAKTKLAQLVQHGELMERYDARLKICGKHELIPDDVMEIMNRAEEATSKNHGFVIPFPHPCHDLSVAHIHC